MKKTLLALLSLALGLNAQAQLKEIYGPFYSGSVFVNKGNLFNPDDLRADSFQAYALTPNVGLQFDYGYLFENGFSVSGGIHYSTCNQKYTGDNSSYAYSLSGTTNASFIKLPITFSHQTRNDKLFKFIYSVGFFYAYTMGYSDKYTLDYKADNVASTTTTITQKEMTQTMDGSSSKATYALQNNVFHRHNIGALAAAGISYRFKERWEFITQLRSEIFMSNVENINKNVLTPTDGTPGFAQYGYVYGNYAKYMRSPNLNDRRSATRPFNLGLTLGLRKYVFGTR